MAVTLYPNILARFLRLTKKGPIRAEDYNALRRELLALQTELGVQPAFPFPSVADYLRGLHYRAGRVTSANWFTGLQVGFAPGTWVAAPAVKVTLLEDDESPSSADGKPVIFHVVNTQISFFEVVGHTRPGVIQQAGTYTAGWIALGQGSPF